MTQFIIARRLPGFPILRQKRGGSSLPGLIRMAQPRAGCQVRENQGYGLRDRSSRVEWRSTVRVLSCQEPIRALSETFSPPLGSIGRPTTTRFWDRFEGRVQFAGSSPTQPAVLQPAVRPAVPSIVPVAAAVITMDEKCREKSPLRL